MEWSHPWMPTRLFRGAYATTASSFIPVIAKTGILWNVAKRMNVQCGYQYNWFHVQLSVSYLMSKDGTIYVTGTWSSKKGYSTDKPRCYVRVHDELPNPFYYNSGRKMKSHVPCLRDIHLPPPNYPPSQTSREILISLRLQAAFPENLTFYARKNEFCKILCRGLDRSRYVT